METVVFPASVISFGNNIFTGTGRGDKLKSITILNPEPAKLESSFDLSEDVFILVPKQSVNRTEIHLVGKK